MARRQVPVDWDGLEIALTSEGDECAWFLDVKTGAVRLSLAATAFGDEVNELSQEEIQAGLDAGILIEIEPLRPAVEHAWMTAFATLVSDAGLREQLTQALEGRGAFSRFKRVLADHPAEEASWFSYRHECLRGAMFRWLAGHDLEATTAPAERPPS